jgi:hypothetical protein
MRERGWASEEGCSGVETPGATTSAGPSAPWPSPTCSKCCSRNAVHNIAAGTDGRFGRGVPARRQLVALAAEPRLGAHHARPPSHFLKIQGIEDAVIQSYSGHATRQSRQDARVAL